MLGSEYLTAMSSVVYNRFIPFMPAEEGWNQMKKVAKCMVPAIIAGVLCRGFSERVLAQPAEAAWAASRILYGGELLCTVLGALALLKVADQSGWIEKKTSFRIVPEEMFQDLKAENTYLRTVIQQHRAVCSNPETLVDVGVLNLSH